MSLIAPKSSLESLDDSNEFSKCHGCKSRVHCVHSTLSLSMIEILPKNYITKIKIKAGDPIYRNGEPLNFLYNVRIGYCKVEYSLEDGRYQINHFALPGQIVGTDGLADGHHKLDVTALTDGELCAIEFKGLHRLMNSQIKIREIYEKLLSRSINNSQEHIFSLGSHSAEQRLALFLLNFYEHHRSLQIELSAFRLPMSREDLKSYLGITAETLSRCLSNLENIGCLEVNNRNISKINLKKLEQIINPKENFSFTKIKTNDSLQKLTLNDKHNSLVPNYVNLLPIKPIILI